MTAHSNSRAIVFIACFVCGWRCMVTVTESFVVPMAIAPRVTVDDVMSWSPSSSRRFSRTAACWLSSSNTPNAGNNDNAEKDATSSSSAAAAAAATLQRVPSDLEGVPIPFVETVPEDGTTRATAFIECYADAIAMVKGIEYTVGVPCDYAVALCYYDEDEQLVPIELDDEIMDDIFPVAEAIITEEFGEELVLQRTPQTLTLVGELDEGEDDEQDEDEGDDDDEEAEEEVEVLMSFEHRDREYHLVRLLDPILLVGKSDPSNPENRLLLSPQESEDVVPLLEELFVQFQEDADTMLP